MLGANLAVLTLLATDPIIILAPPEFLEVVPAESEAVPANGAPIIFGRFGSSPQLVDGVTGASVDVDFFFNAVMPTPVPREEGSVLSLVAECQGCDFAASWLVTAADEEAPVVDGEAVADAPVLLGAGVSDRYELPITLPSVQDEHPAWFELADGLRLIALASPTASTTVRFPLSTAPGARLETCVSVTASDLSGNRTPLAPVCVDVDGAVRSGCSSGGIPHLVVVALLALRRRTPARRRRAPPA
jgi:hypothetical protein